MSEIITYEQGRKIGDAVANAIESDAVREKLRKPLEDIACMLAEEVQYRTIESMPETFEWFVRDMAERVVKAMLAGNESEMRRYLGCDGYTGRDRDHRVIHGELFETGAIALRKQIADAHAALIKSERILDLEDQVSSLVKQVNKLEAANRSLAERVRDLSPSY